MIEEWGSDSLFGSPSSFLEFHKHPAIESVPWAPTDWMPE